MRLSPILRDELLIPELPTIEVPRLPYLTNAIGQHRMIPFLQRLIWLHPAFALLRGGKLSERKS